ncbi:glycoside hydrolase family 71/99-like protein [bacterium]|nr:glycoside hydrolase family 71/99-like protein [bacterium]MDB4506151.1 glycoside hydrolase family 71/99-like protein [bacterium]
MVCQRKCQKLKWFVLITCFVLNSRQVGVCQQIDADAGPVVGKAVVDSRTLTGKVMCGYQGWFSCPEDGSELGWTHWARATRRPFGPGNATVDLWPDVRELTQEERFATQFKHADGRPAEVYSSANKKTILRHFGWMRRYGIDGVFVQRFANGLNSPILKTQKDTVLFHARDAASDTGRVLAVMYDLSGLRKGQVARVGYDWQQLRRDGITQGGRYLHHNGKPLVAVWGVGFSDDREYTLAECGKLIDVLKSEGCAVMLGVPSWWREQKRDAVSDKTLHDILKKADVLSPWTIGRYRSPVEAALHASRVWKPDLDWCAKQDLGFLPVVFPGFSWKNLHGGKLDDIPRLKGEFLWTQITAAKQVGAKMIYVAMFDEVDEGTAVFKCSNDPPVGEDVSFLTYDGLPTDYYLRVTGQGGRILRGQIPSDSPLPPAFPVR